MSETIWLGAIEPWSVSSRRIVMSVTEPGCWCPRMGIPLILVMSTLAPEAPAASVPVAPVAL